MGFFLVGVKGGSLGTGGNDIAVSDPASSRSKRRLIVGVEFEKVENADATLLAVVAVVVESVGRGGDKGAPYLDISAWNWGEKNTC
jgi:hypothetical protein